MVWLAVFSIWSGFWPGAAQAAWVEDSVTLDVSSEDPRTIAASITQFQDILNYLNAESLTSPSRVRIKKFAGRIGRFHWENDSHCSIKDPSGLAPVDMSSAHADFYYESDSSEIWMVETILSKPDPCSGPPPPPPPGRVRAFRK